MSLAILGAICWLVGGLVGSGLLWVGVMLFFAFGADEESLPMLGLSGLCVLLTVVWAVIWIWQLVLALIGVVHGFVGAIPA